MPLRRRPRAHRARAWEALHPRREDRVPRGVASMRRRGPSSARKGGAAPLARAPTRSTIPGRTFYCSRSRGEGVRG
jgi:hypothetical protein